MLHHQLCDMWVALHEFLEVDRCVHFFFLPHFALHFIRYPTCFVFCSPFSFLTALHTVWIWCLRTDVCRLDSAEVPAYTYYKCYVHLHRVWLEALCTAYILDTPDDWRGFTLRWRTDTACWMHHAVVCEMSTFSFPAVTLKNCAFPTAVYLCNCHRSSQLSRQSADDCRLRNPPFSQLIEPPGSSPETWECKINENSGVPHFKIFPPIA